MRWRCCPWRTSSKERWRLLEPCPRRASAEALLYFSFLWVLLCSLKNSMPICTFHILSFISKGVLMPVSKNTQKRAVHIYWSILDLWMVLGPPCGCEKICCTCIHLLLHTCIVVEFTVTQPAKLFGCFNRFPRESKPAPRQRGNNATDCGVPGMPHQDHAGDGTPQHALMLLPGA